MQIEHRHARRNNTRFSFLVCFDSVLSLLSLSFEYIIFQYTTRVYEQLCGTLFLMEYVFLGLGNHGEKYKGTVHNLGKDFIEALVDACGEGWREFSTYRMGTVMFGGQILLCVVSKGYMNDTGDDLKDFLEHIEPLRLVVFQDDSAFPAGRVVMSSGKNHGGHNGIASIEKVLGTRRFIRVRIGVGQKKPLREYVLQHIPEDEKKRIMMTLKERVPAVLARLLHSGLSAAMKECNRRHHQQVA